MKPQLRQLVFLLSEAIALAVTPFFLLISLGLAYLARALTPRLEKPRLVWGPVPILNNKYWSQAMREAGYRSRTFMIEYYSRINEKSDFDEYVFDRYFTLMPKSVRLVLLFWESLFRFDVFFISNDGWLMGRTPLWKCEALLLKWAGKKIVILPYGGDCFVYRNIRSTTTIHALLLSYPGAARTQDAVEQRVRYWMRHADAVIPGCANPDGFGRWSVVVPSTLHLDLAVWDVSKRNNSSDGTGEPVVVVHCPNHTGFKGTEFIVAAVERLKAEGLNVELRLLQNLKNHEVRRIFMEETDLLAEALVYPSYALNAVEGMACGLPVLSNLDDPDYSLMHRRWSFLGECPVLSTSPESILNNLRILVTQPDLRRALGSASRHYVEKYHSLEAAKVLYGRTVDYVYGRLSGKDFMNTYHPLLGLYAKMARVEHPLKESQLVN